jgi:uncharacterized protein YoxC
MIGTIIIFSFIFLYIGFLLSALMSSGKVSNLYVKIQTLESQNEILDALNEELYNKINQIVSELSDDSDSVNK